MTPNEFGQVRYGVEMYSMKEEDFFKMQCLNNKTMFGVFDGHGGKFVARANAQNMTGATSSRSRKYSGSLTRPWDPNL